MAGTLGTGVVQKREEGALVASATGSLTADWTEITKGGEEEEEEEGGTTREREHVIGTEKNGVVPLRRRGEVVASGLRGAGMAAVEGAGTTAVIRVIGIWDNATEAG